MRNKLISLLALAALVSCAPVKNSIRTQRPEISISPSSIEVSDPDTIKKLTIRTGLDFMEYFPNATNETIGVLWPQGNYQVEVNIKNSKREYSKRFIIYQGRLIGDNPVYP